MATERVYWDEVELGRRAGRYIADSATALTSSGVIITSL